MLSPKKTVNTFSEHYVYRLDLGADPFAEGFQANFFYQGGERRKVLEQLVHYGRFSKQPVLFYGDAGSGKKRLLQEVHEQLHAVMDCCRVDVAGLADQDAILAALADRLGLKLDQQHSLSSFINALDFTVSSAEEPDPVLIIIENIQLLEQAEVSFLLDMHQAAEGGIHLLLVASETENANKHKQFLQQQSLKTVALRPLTQQESAEYLQLLLQSVGYAGEFPLNEHQLERLHKAAQGNFAAMHQLVPSLLMRNELAANTGAGFPVPITHVAAIAILAVAIVIAYLYQGEEPALPEQPVAVQQPAAKLSPEPEPKLEAVEAEPAQVIDRSPRPIIASKSPPAAEPSKQQSIEQSAVVAPQAAPKPQASNTPASPAVAQRPVTTSKPIAAKEQRLLDMPSSAYMLQLLGTRKEQSAKDFSSPYQGQLPITYLTTTLKGQPWYVVLVGPYDSREQALAAIKRLPAALQRQKPWARSLSGIQAEIR
ncbi:SPOR domain-containing protein [Dasania sp. GY-MA-18]|uniref:SPOR domain-containing protein n=1 Tax=Dasania phycosphaerae TaxID=2950436 RepID=A0A9J6RKG3_9GAMM|nr:MULTISPECIES: SPOR domain-containing protein [Dasania]MCR8922413.1 SPOR domain-containing protein [Dasania sp. GY-MA-18]MCZ0864841.1 SPOR domain-containing protein [Dasania phycosphaerae]MCZ0868569.1 SPOR domain-containing protein [Dasania phycosphaerae]